MVMVKQNIEGRTCNQFVTFWDGCFNCKFLERQIVSTCIAVFAALGEWARTFICSTCFGYVKNKNIDFRHVKKMRDIVRLIHADSLVPLVCFHRIHRIGLTMFDSLTNRDPHQSSSVGSSRNPRLLRTQPNHLGRKIAQNKWHFSDLFRVSENLSTACKHPMPLVPSYSLSYQGTLRSWLAVGHCQGKCPPSTVQHRLTWLFTLHSLVLCPHP